jgi:prophage regulatory protein
MPAPELRSNEPLQVLRLPQVCRVTGLCRSMIYQLESERRFPGRIKLGLRAVGWIEGEVQEWLAIRIERSRGSQSTSSYCESPLEHVNARAGQGSVHHPVKASVIRKDKQPVSPAS